MNLKQFDVVVLRQELPEHGLREGDVGAVVEIYEPSSVEVEFVDSSGRTKVVLTLDASAVRAVNDAA